MLNALIALTAIAAPPADRVASTPAAPAPQVGQQAPAAQAKPTNYCVVRTVTGSHLRTKTCHTREDWLALGFDPMARRN